MKKKYYLILIFNCFFYCCKNNGFEGEFLTNNKHDLYYSFNSIINVVVKNGVKKFDYLVENDILYIDNKKIAKLDTLKVINIKGIPTNENFILLESIKFLYKLGINKCEIFNEMSSIFYNPTKKYSYLFNYKYFTGQDWFNAIYLGMKNDLQLNNINEVDILLDLDGLVFFKMNAR